MSHCHKQRYLCGLDADLSCVRKAVYVCLTVLMYLDFIYLCMSINSACSSGDFPFILTHDNGSPLDLCVIPTRFLRLSVWNTLCRLGLYAGIKVFLDPHFILYLLLLLHLSHIDSYTSFIHPFCHTPRIWFHELCPCRMHILC